MSDTALIQLLAQKTGATLGKEFSVGTEDRIILDRALTHKVVNLYLEGDIQLKPLISQIRVENEDLSRSLLSKSPDFLARSLDRALSRCRQLYAPDYGLSVAALYFWLFYGGVATKFKIEQSLAHDIFYALTGVPLDLVASSRYSPDLEVLLAFVYEDVLQSAIDVRITSIERYSQLVREMAWLEYWELPN